jgi:hypothetical protein
MHQSLCEMFLDHCVRQSQPGGDFFTRVPILAVKDEHRVGLPRQLAQGPVEFLQPIPRLDQLGRIVAITRSQRGQGVCDIYQLRCAGEVQAMLMQYVESDRKEVCLRATDGLCVRYAQQAQVNFLDQIRQIGGGVLQPPRQKAAQVLTVLLHDLIDKNWIVFGAQRGIRRVVPTPK